MVKKRYFSVILSAIGMLAAIIYSITFGNPSRPEPRQLAMPAEAPFKNYISGSGITEANSHNINVGSQASGVVTELLVKEGDRVKAGEVLFILDQRQAKTKVLVNEKTVLVEKARLDSAKVVLADTEDQYNRIHKLKGGFAVTVDEQMRKEFAYKKAQTDLAVASAQLDNANAQLEEAQTALDLLSVKAPIDGIILKIYARPGEYINLLSQQQPAPVLMGNNNPVYVRVQIDEDDAWRFKASDKAKAFLRSNKDINFNLTFVRIEPYVGPKKQLSGNSTERVDTRVLEVIYKLENAANNIYIGQLMDVYIETGK